MKNKIILIFAILILISFISATNISIMYGQNSSGGYVPFQLDNDGRLKTNLNLVNVTSNAISISENLTLGAGIIKWNASSATYIYYNGTAFKELGTITNAGTAPTGAVMSFNLASCPTGWQLADGTSGTPDLRGIFIRGAGVSGIMKMANGTNFSATFGQYMNDSFQSHTHNINFDDNAVGFGTASAPASGQNIDSSDPSLMGTDYGTNGYGTPRTGAETRPASYALIYCVKTATEDTSSSVFKLVGNVVSLFNSNNSLSIATNISIGNGTIWYNDSDDKYYYYNKTAWLDIGSGSGSGEAVIKSYIEANHTFSVGNAVYYNGSRHLKAISNDSNKLGTGIISKSSAGSFDVTYSGYISGLSGLTAGTFYYVSETQEGNLSTSQGSNFSNPLLQAMSSTTGVVYNWRASEIDTDPIIQYWRNESGVVTSNSSVLIRGNLNVTGNITGGSPVKILGGLQVHNKSGSVQLSVNDSTGVVRVYGNLNVSGDIFGNYTAQNNQYVYNGTDWVPSRATAEGVQQIFLNDSSRKYDAIPENAVMSFNQASCPAGWVLADGTSGTPDLRGIFIRGAGTSGIMKMANGTNFSATYGQYQNDSSQGHWHDFSYNVLGAAASETPFGGTGAYIGGTYMTHTNSSINDGTNGVPRTGAETRPASYALIYCVKTAEDSEASNSIWNVVGNVIKPVNNSKDFAINNSNLYVNVTSGKVGIGTVNTGISKLYVKGDTADDTENVINLVNNNSASMFTVDGVGRGFFENGIYIGQYALGKFLSDGSVGSGSTTLYIGNAAIQVSSDKRLKSNITNTSMVALDKLKQLEVIDFNWNDSSDKAENNRNSRGNWTGLIAQDVVKILPFVVNAPRINGKEIDYESNSTWQIEYQNMVPILVKAIQELNQKEDSHYEELKSENDVLREELCEKDNSYSWC